MELHLPDGTGVHVGEGMGDLRAHEVPQFDAPVTATGDKVGAGGMEVNGGDPVTMTFSSHDVVTGVHVPDLPGAVVGGGSDDLLTHVEGHASNGALMSSDLGSTVESVGHWLVGLGQVWVWTGIFGHSCVLGDTLADSALTEKL